MKKTQGFLLIGTTVFSLGIAACAWVSPPEKAPVNKHPMLNDTAFQKPLLDAAADYQKWGRVDDTTRMAGALCGAQPPPAHIRISKSDEVFGHGKKLYYLYARDPSSYLHLGVDPTKQWEQADPKFFGNSKISPGQIIVKESWLPRSGFPFGVPFPWTERARLLPGDKGPLFIMIKAAPETPGTDEGWIYGTLTPDGKIVTSAGRVQSCMSCHEAAHYDKLFGVAE